MKLNISRTVRYWQQPVAVSMSPDSFKVNEVTLRLEILSPCFQAFALCNFPSIPCHFCYAQSATTYKPVVQ